jgi:ketosteroid isomerase-like protein
LYQASVKRACHAGRIDVRELICMRDVIAELIAAVNAHDLDRATQFFHPDYRSEQPAHPARAFIGRVQFHANWEAMFAGIPDIVVDVRRAVDDGDTTWLEWAWSGTHTDGTPFATAGVALFDVEDGLIVAGRLYMEDVDPSGSIGETVQQLSGVAPKPVEPDKDAR